MDTTLPKALTDSGLLLDSDNKIMELKKLTVEDRAWFRERFKVEHGIICSGPAAL